MAATGGGKIRARRYHIASKPYAKNKQGIISRVTDTVKNIVPGWLQRYFQQNIDNVPPEEECRETVEFEENEEFDQSYTDEESQVLTDGRNTPEPLPGNNADEASTSGAVISFPDLTRPSLHRSHLNFSILDSSSHCPPSTSSAFPINTTGFSLVKEIKDSTSQHEDDNISTTSGFSSRASDKDVTISKPTSLPSLWSPEDEHFQSSSHHVATNLKKPAFNLSIFSSVSPSTGNSSVLNSSHLGDSPFYPGKTTYGGAAAVRTSRVRSTPYQAPVRRQMRAKPASSTSYGVTSVTARRILMSLEKMSSPLADAKRIPSESSPLSPAQNRSSLDDRGMALHQKKVETTTYPPLQKLVTPKAASVNTYRNLYFKPSLSSSVSLNKRNKITEKNVEKQINDIPDGPPISAKSTSYPALSTSAANGLPLSGAGGKMRREKNAHFSSKPYQDKQLAEVPDLPRVALPINTASLPTFSFVAAPSSASPSAPTFTKTVSEKVSVTETVSNSPAFTFSSPIVISTETNVSPVKSIGFTFSNPVVKMASSSTVTTKTSGFNFSESAARTAGVSSTSSITSVRESASHLSNGGVSLSKKNTVEFEGAVKPAKELKEGTVLDILKSPAFASPKISSQSPAVLNSLSFESCKLNISKTSTSANTSAFTDCFKPVTGTWQCDTHLLENSAVDRECVAYQKSKPCVAEAASCGIQNIDGSSMKTTPQSTESLIGFGEKFKPPPGTWECDTCLILNKPDSIRCVACDMPKPGTGVKPALTLPVVSDSSQSVTTPTDSSTLTTTSSLGTGFGDKFKKPEGYWDCSMCFVSNKPEDSKCVACQTAKQGCPVVSSVSASTSDMSGGLLGFSDKFKKPEGSWNCDTCLVQNKVDATQCVACGGNKPGNNETKGTSSSLGTPFRFGIQSSTETLQTVGTTGFKFGDQGSNKHGFGTTSLNSSSSAFGSVGCFKFDKPAGGFKFGTSSPERKAEAADGQKEESQHSNSVTSSLSSASTLSAPNTGTQEQVGKSSSPLGNVSFGTNITSNNSVSEEKGGLRFGELVEKKEAAATPFVLAKPDEKTDRTRMFTIGHPNKKSELGTATEPVFRKPDDKQAPSTSVPFQFGKRKEMEEPKAQLELALCKPEQSQGDAKPAFFDAAKPVFSFGNSEKTMAEQSKPLFSFGANAADQTVSKPAFNFVGSGSTSTSATSTANTISSNVFDQTVSKSSFNFVGSGSSSTCVSTTASTTSSSNVFGSSVSLSSRPISAFVFGQSSSADNNSSFGSTAETVTKPLTFGCQESKPQVGMNGGATVTPFVFGSAGSNTTATPTAFTFGVTASTATSTGTTLSTPSFAFGSGSSVPSITPAFGTSQIPTFGQSSSQSSAPSFGSPSLLPTGSQPPSFGSLPGSSQSSVFGQQPNPQPAFGTAAPSSNSGGFQFAPPAVSTFNFTSANPSGVFQFGASSGGASTAAPAAQTAVTASGVFQFNPSTAFNLGAPGKTPFSTSGRKMKTAVRRRK